MKVSRNPVAVETNNEAKIAPFGSRTVRSTPAMLLPVTAKVSFRPAVPAKVRVATSTIVPTVTAVGEPIAVAPVLLGTSLNVNVSEPTSWSRGSTVIA